MIKGWTGLGNQAVFSSFFKEGKNNVSTIKTKNPSFGIKKIL